MSIVLGGVTLSDSLQWTDQGYHSPVRQSTNYTLGGTLIVHSAVIAKGASITLEAMQDTGWVTKAMVDALRTLADGPAGVYTLDFHGMVYSVKFDHRNGDALRMRPLQPQVPQPDDSYYIGTIKLFTV